MASRHFSLVMTDLGDVIDMLQAFDTQNNVHTVMAFSLVKDSPKVDLLVTAEAWARPAVDPVAKPLASVSVTCLGMNLRTWGAVLTHVLFALDFKLALNEWDGSKPK